MLYEGTEEVNIPYPSMISGASAFALSMAMLMMLSLPIIIRKKIMVIANTHEREIPPDRKSVV